MTPRGCAWRSSTPDSLPTSHERSLLLLDDYLPTYDANERHSTLVRAPADRVYDALWSADLASPLVRALIGIRALPGLMLNGLRRPRDAWRRLRERTAGRVTMHELAARGFTLLAEDPPHEVVLGVVGTFWRMRGDMRPVDATTFRDGQQPAGTARAAWNFCVTERTDGSCLLSTETRVLCADPAGRRRFRIYWAVVRPGSGLIRRSMLRSVRRAAEQSPSADPAERVSRLSRLRVHRETRRSGG